MESFPAQSRRRLSQSQIVPGVATPIFEIYKRWQLELERQLGEFLCRRADDLMNEARATLATSSQSGNGERGGTLAASVAVAGRQDLESPSGKETRSEARSR